MIYPPDSVISSFTFSPLLGYVGEPILFTDLSGNTAINDPCTYEWDWGDGTVWGITKNASHTYSRVGNYTVVHWVTGSSSRNPTRDSKTLTVPVGEHAVQPKVCDPSKGNSSGITANTAPYSEKWRADGSCINPYICTCDPAYAKYRCDPGIGWSATLGWSGGYPGQTLIGEQNADCCAFCGAPALPPDVVSPVEVPVAIFEIESVIVDPAECNVGDFITAVANVRNNGTAAGAATVVFYWSDGSVFGDLPRTTSTIDVNATTSTPPAAGKAPSAGVLKLCAVFR